MKSVRVNSRWHLRIGIQRSFVFQLHGRWKQWNWVRLAMTRQWTIHRCLFLDSFPDLQRARASKKQSRL
ncbi:MAG: hypothetical protein WBB29_04110 [Geitlerinemataceae cyanobacterium]